MVGLQFGTLQNRVWHCSDFCQIHGAPVQYFPSQTSTAKEIGEIFCDVKDVLEVISRTCLPTLFLFTESWLFSIAVERNMSHAFARRLMKKKTKRPSLQQKKKNSTKSTRHKVDVAWFCHSKKKKLPLVRNKVRLKGSFPLQRTASNVEVGPCNLKCGGRQGGRRKRFCFFFLLCPFAFSQLRYEAALEARHGFQRSQVSYVEHFRCQA